MFTNNIKGLLLLSQLSQVWFFATPWTVAHQAPLPMGFSRQEYWSGCHFLLQGIHPSQGPCIGRWILYHWTTREGLVKGNLTVNIWPGQYPITRRLKADKSELQRKLLYLQWVKVKVKSLSRVRLFATPWTVAYHVPLLMGFTRQDYWSGLPSVYKFSSSSFHDYLSALQLSCI